VELVREEGFFALYKGVTPVMLRAFPANAVSNCQEYLLYSLHVHLNGFEPNWFGLIFLVEKA